jgi:hypothetical protein
MRTEAVRTQKHLRLLPYLLPVLLPCFHFPPLPLYFHLARRDGRRLLLGVLVEKTHDIEKAHDTFWNRFHGLLPLRIHSNLWRRAVKNEREFRTKWFEE